MSALGALNKAFIPRFKVLSRFGPSWYSGFLHGVIMRPHLVCVLLVAGTIHQINQDRRTEKPGVAKRAAQHEAQNEQQEPATNRTVMGKCVICFAVECLGSA
jgi:hypothetical protein